MAKAETPCTGPLAAFTKLKIGELLPVTGAEADSPTLSSRLAAPLEHGLLAREVFDRYGAWNNGRLGVPEFHWLLRDHGIVLDYAGTCRALNGVTNPGEQGIDFDNFSRVVAEAGTRHRAYTEEVVILLHGVFNSYDQNKSGLLERRECLTLLRDAGRGSATAEDTQELFQLISSCRQEGVPGPLNFDQFLALLQHVHRHDESTAKGDMLLL